MPNRKSVNDIENRLKYSAGFDGDDMRHLITEIRFLKCGISEAVNVIKDNKDGCGTAEALDMLDKLRRRE